MGLQHCTSRYTVFSFAYVTNYLTDSDRLVLIGFDIDLRTLKESKGTSMRYATRVLDSCDTNNTYIYAYVRIYIHIYIYNDDNYLQLISRFTSYIKSTLIFFRMNVIFFLARLVLTKPSKRSKYSIEMTHNHRVSVRIHIRTTLTRIRKRHGTLKHSSTMRANGHYSMRSLICL